MEEEDWKEKEKKILTTFSLPDLVLGFRMPIILLATLEDSMVNYVTRGHATSITKWLDPSRGINNVGQFALSLSSRPAVVYIVLIKIPFSAPGTPRWPGYTPEDRVSSILRTSWWNERKKVDGSNDYNNRYNTLNICR